MQISGIPFGITDWTQVARSEHRGECGSTYWRTQHFGTVRVRMVEYSPGYVADHWCVKGHVLLCIEGELHTEPRCGRARQAPAVPDEPIEQRSRPVLHRELRGPIVAEDTASPRANAPDLTGEVRIGGERRGRRGGIRAQTPRQRRRSEDQAPRQERDGDARGQRRAPKAVRERREKQDDEREEQA